MAEAITNELMFEVLKKIQGDIAEIKHTLADHTRQFIDIRKRMKGLHKASCDATQ